MAKIEERRTVVGPDLELMFNKLACRVQFEAGGYVYDETFVYDGISLRELTERATRKDVIARGQKINQIKSDEATEAFREEGSHRIYYKDSSKAITTAADRMAAARTFWASLTDEEKSELK